MGEIKISIFVENINHHPAEMKIITIILSIFLTGTGLHAQVPLNWTIDEINPNEDLALYPDESVFTEGVRSCRLQLNSGAVPYLISDAYDVSPGTAYVFSIDVLDNDTAGQIKVYADFYDSNHFNIYGATPVFSSDSSEWQTISWAGTIPAQAVQGYVLIKFYCQPDLYHFTKSARAWIDNIQFHQAGGANLVENGSFEGWIVGVEEAGQEEDQFVVYPNPVVDIVNIDLPETAEMIVISDLMGKEVLKMNVEGRRKIQLDITQLSGGLYLTKVILENSSFQALKLIKQ
jgi:hypothetical protein